jgi:hypothetical protein
VFRRWLGRRLWVRAGAEETSEAVIAIRQLCFDGEIYTDFIGVRVQTALDSIRDAGFRNGTQLRLRLRGRTWIEDVDRPAVRA